MNLFETIAQADFEQQDFAFLEIEEVDNVLTITLDRANKKNALHPQMVNEIAYAFQYAHHTKNIWMIVLQAKGDVFCAGADLKAMLGSIEPNDSTIPKPKTEILIAELFNKIHKPTITKVAGDVYAGGFFFLAGSNIVLAQNDVKFGLPEVKRGLYPFQVMAALMRVMPERKVLDWCIRGYNLPVKDAEQFGLVTKVVEANEIDKEVNNIINELKQNSPTAISNGLKAYDHLQPSQETHQYLSKMLMQTAKSKDGQEGLTAFREKRKPIWTRE